VSPIPPKVKAEILADPYYKTCARSQEGECEGRVTFEHAWIYGSKQIQEVWAIIPICAYHHAVDEFQDGDGLDKGLNQYIALCRADIDDLCARMPKKNWRQEYKYLHSKYATS